MNSRIGTIPAPLAAWLALLVLSFAGLLLGEVVGHSRGLPLMVAVIIWVKGSLVARYFIGSPTAHPFIAWVVRAFVAFVPVALVLTGVLGR